MIQRFAHSSEVLETFSDDNPSQQIYMVTGVRGSGKTVFMTSIARKLEEDSWIVVELNSSGEILKELAAKLYNTKGLSRIFDDAGIDLSFFGISVNIKKNNPITDLGTAVELMLSKLSKRHKRILITIDEVSNTKEMQYFAGVFQILVRHKLPVFLLMTGLYENINKLQNEENLTFLYRAPKLYLGALNIGRIADSYEKLLGLSREDALSLAKMSKGYPLAFQVLGYFSCNKGGDYKAALPDARQYLAEYVYEKIWLELSRIEKDLLTCIALRKQIEVKAVKAAMDLPANEFSVYRDRLIKKGLLDGSTRGVLRLTLPFFDDYVNEHADL